MGSLGEKKILIVCVLKVCAPLLYKLYNCKDSVYINKWPPDANIKKFVKFEAARKICIPNLSVKVLRTT